MTLKLVPWIKITILAVLELYENDDNLLTTNVIIKYAYITVNVCKSLAPVAIIQYAYVTMNVCKPLAPIVHMTCAYAILLSKSPTLIS